MSKDSRRIYQLLVLPVWADGRAHDAAQELAFASCARVLGADREMARQELQVLARLKTQFGLRAADVAHILPRQGG